MDNIDNNQLVQFNLIKFLTYNFQKMSTITHLTDSYENKAKIKSLDLRSTSSNKIRCIQNLDPFVNLRTLILSNNMITEICGLSNLHNLKTLNLQFNNIKEIKGTQSLVNLQELFLSYNQIQYLGSSLKNNRKLRILFLAYNEIENLEDLAILYSNETQTEQQKILFNENKKQFNDDNEEIRAQEQYQIYQSPNNLSPQKNSILSSPVSPNNRTIVSNMRFPYLTHLSIANNPVIQKLNYTRFLAMLIPTLTNIDETNIDGDTISNRENSVGLVSQPNKTIQSNNCGLVQPNQQIVILREAIDGLLDEKQEYIRRFQEQAEKMRKIKENYKSDSNIHKNVSIDRHISRIILQQKQWEQILLAMSQKYRKRLETDRKKISEISEIYTGIITTKRQKQNDIQGNFTLSLQNREQGPKIYEANGSSRQLLEQLKQLQYKSDINKNKLKRVNYLLNRIKQAISVNQKIIDSPSSSQKLQIIDTTKMVMQYMIFGKAIEINSQEHMSRKKSRIMNNYYSDFKKSLIQLESACNLSQDNQTNPFSRINLINYRDFLLELIFNQDVSIRQNPNNATEIALKSAFALKKKIGQKSLLQIISQLHISSQNQKSDQEQFLKNRKKFIKQFEYETKKLIGEFQSLERQKQEFQAYKNSSVMSIQEVHQKEIRKYQKVEDQQKQKIRQLKKIKQQMSIQHQNKQKQLFSLNEQIQAKVRELQEFQRYFQEFIEDKQKIEALSENLIKIQQQVRKQEDKFNRLAHHVQNMKIQEGNYQAQLNKLELDIHERKAQIRQMQEYREKITSETNEQINSKNARIDQLNEKLQEQYSKIMENKQLEKTIERTHKSYALLQQKIKNLQKMHQVKKQQIREAQKQMQILNRQKGDIIEEMKDIQNKISRHKQQHIRYQMKLRENRLAMESLSDLNCSINQMMVRQSELKRNNIQLQIENRNLLEMRNSLKQDLRMKNYL